MKLYISLVIFAVIAVAHCAVKADVKEKHPRCPPYEDEHSIAYHFEHETDCTKFYKCGNGYAYLMNCPKGLHFNRDLQVCDWPCHAGCETEEAVLKTYKC